MDGVSAYGKERSQRGFEGSGFWKETNTRDSNMKKRRENPPLSDIKGHFIFYFLQKEIHNEDSKMLFNYGWCVFMILKQTRI